MGFKMGNSVGLAEVGKSTLFQRATKNSGRRERAAIFRFCTIEPNVGEVAVRHARLDKLAEIAGSSRSSPHGLTFRRILPVWSKARPKAKDWSNQFLQTSAKQTPFALCCACF